MAVFGRSIDVEIVHAPGTVEEKRWSTTMGGDLATKALFHPVDRVVTGDEVHASLFDEPRVISSVNPVTTLDGTVSHWEARMTPLSRWQLEAGHLFTRKAATGVQIFISHSSEDHEVAKRLTDLLRSALKLSAGSIRCTSVEGHRLPGGADTAHQLKREIREATTFIGIVSPRSIKSMYVLFELGARWGADKHLVPLLAPGARADQLVGPMAGINALRGDSRADLHQLVRELASDLRLALEPAEAYERQLELVTLSPAVSAPNASAPPEASVDLLKNPVDDTIANRPITVRAKQMGFHGNVRRRPGAVFTITSEKEFSNRWMERVADVRPLAAEVLDGGRGHLEKIAATIAAANKPLKVDLSLKKNEGGTPGVHLLARNGTADPLPDVVVCVRDIRLWNEELSAFVTTSEVYGNELTFTELQVGQSTLHPTRPVDVAFIRAENNRIQITRHGSPKKNGNPNIERYDLRSYGIWQLSLRVRSADGRTIDQTVCLSWDEGQVFPEPCACPMNNDTAPILSIAPAPHSPVR
jgi:hypothetical protein